MRGFLILFLCCAAVVARADGEDPATLMQEAKQILAEHRDKPVAPARYAQCVINLERAQTILEGAGDSTSVLAQEVNSTLFWAKRFSTIDISNEINKQRGAGGTAAKSSVTPTPIKPALPSIKPSTPAPAQKLMLPEAEKLEAAKAAFQQAEQFAHQKSGDPLAVALRWFQVASSHGGTEYALKALERAHEARARQGSAPGTPAPAGEGETAVVNKRAQIEAEEQKGDKPEITIMIAANRLAAAGSYAQAIEQYKASIKLKDTISAESRMGHTYFKLAQKNQEELLPKYKTAENAYGVAYRGAFKTIGGNKYFDDRDPRLQAAERTINELRKDSDKIILLYLDAQTCFEKILKLVPGGKDFDAAAYAGISLAKRKSSQVLAKQNLPVFLKDYKPTTLDEQITYEFVKSELERINK